MIVADALANWLEENEITHAFGIIGAGNLALWEAIDRKGATQIICCHHEQAAVFAAAYFHRVSGKTALALVTTGAGSTNAITGVMSAWMDSVPVIVISGNEPLTSMNAPTRTKGVQGYLSADLADGFTKASACVNEGAVIRTLDFFFGMAFAGRPGPVWIDIPMDVQRETIR